MTSAITNIELNTIFNNLITLNNNCYELWSDIIWPYDTSTTDKYFDLSGSNGQSFNGHGHSITFSSSNYGIFITDNQCIIKTKKMKNFKIKIITYLWRYGPS